MFHSCVKHLAGKASKRAKDQGHIAISLSVFRREVIAAQGCDGERVVLEHRNTRHSEVDVLARAPCLLGWYGDFDSILREDRDCALFTNEPGHSEWVDPIEVENSHAIRHEPDSGRCKKVIPGRKVVVAVPEKHAQENDRDRDM